MQIMLFIVIIILAILLSTLGIQLFFILREFRKTVFKANKVLDDTEAITHSVCTPIVSLSSLAGGVKAGASIINIFKKVIAKDEISGKKNRKDSNE